jgi:restriction system protein
MANTSQAQIDITYHYPPELLELLCDAIPCLFRAKQGVIDFFKGAGVPAKMWSDWQQKLTQDKDNVRKHVMTRQVLCRLNDAGESALATRREVLKRVSEFDDFSSCWDNDRLKAQGLVAQIQKLVNVKDSFTRMKLEQERERKQRQAVYSAEMEAKQKKNQERGAIKEALYGLFAETDPHKRGKQLEAVLNRLFDFAGCLVREAFTIKGDEGQGIVEQIDGAVEIDSVLFLVEMKWWNAPIGRGDLAPHMVGVYGRPPNVGGMFISYSGFSAAAIEDAKSGLTQKIFVLMELQEIIQVIEREGDLKGLFREKINRAKSDRNPFYKPS